MVFTDEEKEFIQNMINTQKEVCLSVGVPLQKDDKGLEEKLLTVTEVEADVLDSSKK